VTLVAIHQPNYLPWLGYFHKISKADLFVFLDDTQFPKQGYVNRVQIQDNGRPSWLTIPARPSLGTPIYETHAAQEGWSQRHLSRLRNTYRKAPAFREVWPGVENLYGALDPDATLASTNSQLVVEMSGLLGLTCRFAFASAHPNSAGLAGGGRLVDIVTQAAGTGYLSGRGGAKYQDPSAFEAAGLDLVYTTFQSRPYPQASEEFAPGLSVLDAVFNLGFEATATHLLLDD
jgi:hypothetical protein